MKLCDGLTTTESPLELAGARLAPYLAAPCLLHSTSARPSLTNPHPLILINTQGGLRYTSMEKRLTSKCVRVA